MAPRHHWQPASSINSRWLGSNIGPTQAAAQLESFKDFAKAIHGSTWYTNREIRNLYQFSDAKQYVEEQGTPIVIKADGLAAGKGVVVAMTFGDAIDALDMMLGDSAGRVVIEEFMEGEEASFICLCDGKNALPFASSQDHKRIFDHDEGPNTGGMGRVFARACRDARNSCACYARSD